MRTPTTLPPTPERPDRILIVDDDEARRRMFAILLKKAGYEVRDLDDGRAMIEVAREFEPDLLLLDVMLPGQSGMELTREVRTDPQLRSTPVILVTAALDDEDSIVRGLSCGADDYLVTPVGLGELKARIGVQLRNRRDREALRWAFDQRKQYKEESERDPLTGIANRRVGQAAIDEALAEGRPVLLALLDIDHFKRVNDTYGHPAGDAVLTAVARALAAQVRPEDVVARFGGEEFAVVFSPSTRADSAAELGERLRAAVSALTFDEAPGVPRVTISVGVVGWDGKGERPAAASLLARADAALYAAKQAGRDRVVIAPPVG